MHSACTLRGVVCMSRNVPRAATRCRALLRAIAWCASVAIPCLRGPCRDRESLSPSPSPVSIATQKSQVATPDSQSCYDRENPVAVGFCSTMLLFCHDTKNQVAIAQQPFLSRQRNSCRDILQFPSLKCLCRDLEIQVTTQNQPSCPKALSQHQNSCRDMRQANYVTTQNPYHDKGPRIPVACALSRQAFSVAT